MSRLPPRAVALTVASLLVVAPLACACAEPGFHMAADAPASMIEGRVTIGPVRSVERRGVANREPYQAAIIVLDNAGREVTTVQSDAEGRFRFPLPPGKYVLRPQSPGLYPRAPEQRVQVKRGAATQVEIRYDSGRR